MVTQVEAGRAVDQLARVQILLLVWLLLCSYFLFSFFFPFFLNGESVLKAGHSGEVHFDGKDKTYLSKWMTSCVAWGK